MEARGDEETDYKSVIEHLCSMFNHVISEEVIATLVESCGGDLNLSVDAIMKITNDDNVIPKEEIEPPASNMPNASSQSNAAPVSYAAQAAPSRGAIAKQITKVNKQSTRPPQIFWTDQIREIIRQHNQGSRILILMRGAPGSGKTHLAKSLVESMVGPAFTNYKIHILSTDDYFMVRGQYQYDKFKLSYAHAWNQERAKLAMFQGLSPIIIDNTNIEQWEMHPYLVEGVRNGYIIEVVEPTTPWVKKANQLFKRNSHNVPLHTIKRMLDNFVEGVTGENLRQSFGLSYPSNMIPPVKRLIPPIEEDGSAPNTAPNVESITVQNTSLIPYKPLLNETEQNLQSQNIIVNTTDNIPQQVNDVAAEQINDYTTNEQIYYEYLQAHNISGSNTNNDTEQVNEVTVETTNNILLDSYQNENQPEVNNTNEDIDELSQEDHAKQKLFLEVQQKIEELEKFEAEWENGEKWDETDGAAEPAILVKPSTPITANASRVGTPTSSENTASLLNLGSKPPRKEKNYVNEASASGNDSLMKTVNDCQDWRNISLFLPPWVSPDEQPNIIPVEEVPIEKTTSSTCVEAGDTSLSGEYKVIVAAPRDINEFYVPPEREKIPEKRMLDKSTLTNEGIVMTMNCPQKERHFYMFRKLFKHIERESLRFIFDNCCGDVNWAVENVFGGGVTYQLKSTENEEDSDTEEEPDFNIQLPCTCLAKYEIIPHDCKPDNAQLSPKVEESPDSTPELSSQSEKKKKDTTISDENLQLKRQIEQNVVISDSHYSEHCLKIRKMRRGEYYNKDDNNSEQPSTSGTPDLASGLDSGNTTAPIIDSSDDEDGSNSNISESDKIVNINVGRSFIKDLDDMFGRQDMDYPENIQFNISIPTSLLNEINALWMESLMFQLDDCAKKSAIMLEQDEEFARQVALKEQEFMLQGREPDVPDFKEIMDLEFAISLHIKDMSEWKNNVPKDLAAKMTHEKLYNLFPEIDKDTLLEMLMAHENNFKATVEVLLVSMGKGDILETENGLNKFVMEKELERQAKLLEEQQKELSEAEWPPLPKGEAVQMATVQEYRDEADKHLSRRNTNMQRAEEYFRRGMTQVANYYSGMAILHKTKYEQANSLAVATLMQYHANKSPDNETVDLHYFRVKEAKEAMDLFIDTHIHKLRESNKRNTMLFFITGRGLHSPGQPKVKPACIKRLRERGLHYTQCNPGLLRARVSCDDKLTYQIP